MKVRVGPSFRLLSSGGWAWASGMFVGERHRFVVEAEAGALEGIESWEFHLFRHLVADIAIVAREGERVTIEALTLTEV